MIKPFAVARRLMRWRRVRKEIDTAIETRFCFGMTNKTECDRHITEAYQLLADLRRMADALETDIEIATFRVEQVWDEVHPFAW